MKDHLKNLGFNFNHIAVIAVVVFAFSFYALPKLGFKPTALFAKANNAEKMISYDSVRREVYAQMGNIPITDKNKTADQIALLDRGGSNPQVLGEMIGIGTIPSAEDMVLPEMEQRYPVRIIDENSEGTKAAYKEITTKLERKYSVMSLMAAMNSSDKNVLTRSAQAWDYLLTELSAVNTPSELKDFHRTKIGYYYAMMKVTQVYAGLAPESELGLYTKAMLAFTGQF